MAEVTKISGILTLKIMLATPPEYRRLMTPTQVLGPPIGLLYIAACLRDADYTNGERPQITVFDAFTKGLFREEFVESIQWARPDILGISVTSRMFPVTISALAELHISLPEMKVVLGGIHPTFLAREIVSTFPYVNYVIKGEAERSFPDLVDCIISGQDVSLVKGLTCLVDGKFIDNPADTIHDLDSLPIPARDMVSDMRYGFTWNGIDLTYGKFTSIVTSRGCPYTCNFCINWMFSNRKWRIRSVQSVVEEMEQLTMDGYNSCVIIDDVFTVNQKRVIEMCKEIKERKIDLVFYCEGRVDSANPEVLRTMRSAGFSSILFGIESGSQRVLNDLHKGTTPAQAREAVKNAKEAELKVVGAFIVGSPVENREDYEATLQHIKELDLDGMEVNVLSIAPWGPRYQQLKLERKVRDWDWLSDHLVSDYYPEHSQVELAKLVEEAYYAFFRIGFRKNARKVINYILRHKDARNAIFRNLLNPNAWTLIAQRGRARHKIEETLIAGSELELIGPLLHGEPFTDNNFPT